MAISVSYTVNLSSAKRYPGFRQSVTYPKDFIVENSLHFLGSFFHCLCLSHQILSCSWKHLNILHNFLKLMLNIMKEFTRKHTQQCLFITKMPWISALKLMWSFINQDCKLQKLWIAWSMFFQVRNDKRKILHFIYKETIAQIKIKRKINLE